MHQFIPEKVKFKDFVRSALVFPEPKIVTSNLGTSYLCGFGKVPRDILERGSCVMRMLARHEDLIQDFHIGRADFLTDSEGTIRLIETEFRSHGIGLIQRFVTGTCSEKFDFIRTVQSVTGIHLQDVTVLYSGKREFVGGGCYSDDHLYCANQIPWSERISDALLGRPAIVRSQFGERVPDSLCSVIVHSEVQLVMPFFEANKAKTYLALYEPFAVFSRDTIMPDECSEDFSVQHVKKSLLFHLEDDFRSSSLVCKPVFGAQSRDVFRITRSDIEELDESSQAFTCIQGGSRYVIQPFYPSLHEVPHLYRLFFLRKKFSSEWQFCMGLLQFGSDWIVHGGDGTEHVLLLPR